MRDKISSLEPARAKRRRFWWRAAAVLFSVVLLILTVLALAVRRWIPPELRQDIRAGIGARHIADPDARIHAYLEARYGSLSDPANRQKAFLDFFDVEHIKALQMMVKHGPKSQRHGSIMAMSRWVENYRESLTPRESATLRARFQTPEGRAMLRRATAQYNSQDVQYRGQTAVVISQLLKTINSVQNP